MTPYKKYFAKMNGLIVLENLLLKRHGGKIVVVSDESDRKKASNETWRSKEKLKAAGFRWDRDINSWTIDAAQLGHAQQTLSRVNKSPIEKLVDKVEELPEFLAQTENLSAKDELGQRIDGFVTELTGAVDAAAQSAIIRNFLTFNSKFRQYSFHNTLLIYLQNKKATKVAGFRQWEEKFHRQVKKGAKGIAILAPIVFKAKDEPAATPTPSAGGAGATGDVDEPESTPTAEPRRYMRFRAVYVFDIADTEPMDATGEIPEAPAWHGSDEPNAKADEVYNCAVEMANEMGIKIERGTAAGEEQGRASGNHINITSTVEGVNKAATVIHEIAHELLHFKKSSPFYVGDEQKITREVAELQAESVSFVVIRHYDLPAEHQATYLALWQKDKNALRGNLDVIKKTAYFIIDGMDKIQKDKPQTSPTVEQPPVDPPVETPSVEEPSSEPLETPPSDM